MQDKEEFERVEKALQESEERYRIIAETASDAIITINEESRIIFVNQAVEKIFNYRPEELLGQKITLLMPERLQNAHLNAMKRYLETGRKTKKWGAIELSGLHRSGKEISLEISYGEFKGNGRHFFTGIIRDITERKQAQEMLRETNQTLKSLIQAAPIAILVLDPEGNVKMWNPAAERIFGWTEQEVIGKPYPVVLVPEVRHEEYDMWHERVLSGEIFTDMVFTRKRKDGSLIDVSLSTSPLYDPIGAITGVIVLLADITDRRRAEEEKAKLESQLRQSQKMEAIGQLASGIAHDFNNILTAIINYGSLLHMSLSEDDPSRTHVEQILSLADRATSLTQDLLAFSRKQIMNPTLTNLNDIIKKFEELLSRLMGEEIELRTVLSGKDLPVMADIGQIEQVLINLATNARDAMQGKGFLTIRTDLLVVDAETSKSYGLEIPGTYALISVTDTGMGMDEKTKERIFEPFFTTKEAGKGTGLGLSIVYGIIKQHKGHIIVYSEPGKGTTFKIYLPVIESAIAEEKAAELTFPLGGTETILLAEDDAEVRATTREVLKKFGYTVIETADGADAIQAFKEHKNKIDLLVFDVIMPNKNGKEAYEEIRKIRPDIKVLFTSGYTSDILLKKGILEEGFDLISKPALPREFLKKIREVMSR